MNKPEANLTGHIYDGIQEYDNPTPGWWKFLFVFFCIFGFFYYLYFHLGVKGRSIHDQYNRHLSQVMEKRFAEIGELSPDSKTILKYMNDPKWVKVGETVFKTNCANCHGMDGKGMTGPNLTDDFWKNVQRPADIARVISEGANNGAMPAWKNRLGHINKIVLTAAYVASLRKPDAGGKGPEGKKIDGWK